MKWQADKTPRYGLMLKYLRRIIPPAQLNKILKDYVAAKQQALDKAAAKARASRGKKK